MDLALAVLLLWGLLFVPPALVVHWLVLGAGARVRALPLVPVTGIALATLVLAVLGRFGVQPDTGWVSVALVAVSVACAVVVWRRPVPWRSRELIGAGLLLALTLFLVQLPVFGGSDEGPLGYGTAADPVSEVAAIEAAAGGPSADRTIARDAAESKDERAIGFEQFAAFTVALGASDSSDTADAADWSAYRLHAIITGLLASLVLLPLFAFARARGVRWLGLLVLVPLGVLAPAMFLALANGEGAAIASVAFTVSAVFSLLVTRRDRGWWALVVLFGAAIAATAGPLALLPLVMVGVAWMFVRSDTYEHLSQHDEPVSPRRALVMSSVAAALGVVSVFPLFTGGELLSWSALHTELGRALLSWPFAWLDTDLSTAGPSTPFEYAIWAIGPVLLLVAAIYAIVRNERRELGVLVGAVAAALLGAAVGLADETAGIRLFEFTILSVSPLLAALAIRAVALARESAEEMRGERGGRLAGLGPTGLVLAFVLVSFSATAVTGTRMVHAPKLTPAGSIDGTTLVAAGDPWLAFALDGERVRGGYADADAVSESGSSFARRGIRTEGYDGVVLSSSPLSSDPSLRYLEQSDLDPYQVRLFRDRVADPDLTRNEDQDVERAWLLQRIQSQTADRSGSADAPASDPAVEDGAAADAVVDTLAAPFEYVLAQVHTPVEGDGENTPADRPAGRLLPPTDIKSCTESRDIVESTCAPTEPSLGPGCTDRDVRAVRSPLDRSRSVASAVQARRAASRAQVVVTGQDELLPDRPPLLGVQCFDVPLEEDSSVLLVHLRDIGHILAPERAITGGPADAWSTEREEGRVGGVDGVSGGTRLVTSSPDAALDYGDGRLRGTYDLVLEGSLGAGVDLSTDVYRDPNGPASDDEDALQSSPLDVLRGSADGFSAIVRNASLVGVARVTNDAGTDVELGRLFARPVDLPRSCDMPIALASGEQREVRVDVRDAAGNSAGADRPGLTLAVVGVSGSGSSRVARVALGTYLTRSGLVRYSLIDWTEQFEDTIEVDGCDGTRVTENGAVPESADRAVDPQQLAGALRSAADAAG